MTKTTYTSANGNLIDRYFIGRYTIIHNVTRGEITIVYGEDGMCGATDLEAAFKFCQE